MLAGTKTRRALHESQTIPPAYRVQAKEEPAYVSAVGGHTEPRGWRDR